MTPESLLREGLSGWGLAADAAPRLLEFSDRLLEKNRVMNLTAITDPVDVVTLHLLDCAVLLRMEDFRGKRVVDVGTGAGFPGMPLRLLEPDFDLTLLDSLGKRVAFLQEVCNAMALQRVTCVHARAEEFAALLTERGLEVILWDERMSTVASERVLMEGNVRREDRKTYIDKMAAAFILQGYLDYQSFSENQAESEDSEDI